MTISTGLFTFLNLWFLCLFLVGPFYVRSAKEPGPLDYAAAPEPMPWKKLLLTTTLASACFTLLLAAVIHSGLFSMRDISF